MDFRCRSVSWAPLPLASSAVASDNCCATTGSMVISPVSVFHDARMPGPGLATVTTSSLGSAGFWTARRLRCTKDRAAARAAARSFVQRSLRAVQKPALPSDDVVTVASPGPGIRASWKTDTGEMTIDPVVAQQLSEATAELAKGSGAQLPA